MYSKVDSDILFASRSITGYLRNRLNILVILVCILNTGKGNVEYACAYASTKFLWRIINFVCVVIMILGMYQPTIKSLYNPDLTNPKPVLRGYSLVQLMLHLIASYFLSVSMTIHISNRILYGMTSLLCGIVIIYSNQCLIQKDKVFGTVTNKDQNTVSIETCTRSSLPFAQVMSCYYALLTVLSFFSLNLPVQFENIICIGLVMFNVTNLCRLLTIESKIFHILSIVNMSKILCGFVMFMMMLFESKFMMICVVLEYMCNKSLTRERINIDRYVILFVFNQLFKSTMIAYLAVANDAVWMLYCLYIICLTISHTREAIFKRNKRVYCCGVFDLMHEGHFVLFQNMSMHGDVIVGVLDDPTVESYKRIPVMTHAERCDAVRMARYVDEIIPHCPLYTTSAFMNKHDIDAVGISEEYYKPPFQYYEDCVRENKYVVMPRYNGISTSDLIKRIQTRKDL